MPYTFTFSHAPRELTLPVALSHPSGGTKCLNTALLDTGATDCFISHAIFDELHLTEVSYDALVRLPTGEMREKQVAVDFIVKARDLDEVYLRAIVFDVERYPVVLGMPWFNEVHFKYGPAQVGRRLEIRSR